MAFITWTDELSVGVDFFDQEHQELVSIINRLHIGIVSGNQTAQLAQTLNSLIVYTRTHFKHEEDYMIMYDYSGYEDHKAEHTILVNKVLEYQDQLNNGKSAFTLELMKFLKDWILKHIAGTDMKYREHFQSKGFN